MRNWVIGGIIVLAFVLRVVGLSQHPAGFTPDEASFGYDAYSLLQTGKDQWGTSWPLTFKSFGDYKLPLYTYLAMPFVAFFGLTEFAVRLPNALLGTAAVFVTYLLVKELKLGNNLAIVSALLMALSPWHIPMSRGAFEANLTTFFLPLGIWAFIKAQQNTKYYFLAALAFGLNMFTYHSARMITPLVVLSLIYLYRNKIKLNNNVLLSFVLFSLFTFVTILTLFSGSGTRVSTSTIFSEQGYTNAFADRFTAVLNGLPPVMSTLINNKYVYILNEFVQQYVTYYSIPFYWTQGPAEATYGMMPGFGVLYWFESIFIAAFVIYLFNLVKKSNMAKEQLLLVIWLLLAPIPAALSIGPGYAANRAVIMLPALHIASAIGGLYLYSLVSRKLSFKIVSIFIAFTLFVSSLFFLEEYFYQQPLDGGPSMMYGVRQVFEGVNETEGPILVSKKLSEPHIYAAFYHQIDPLTFQQESANWNFAQQGFKWVDQMPEYRLNNFTFRNPHLDVDLAREYSAVVITTEEIKEGIDAYLISYPDGKPAYYVIK